VVVLQLLTFIIGTQIKMTAVDCQNNNTILNPVTNRCVKVDGKIGKAILSNSQIKPKPVKRTKKQIEENIEYYNDKFSYTTHHVKHIPSPDDQHID